MICASSEDSDQLGLRPVWSESSLSAWRKLGSLATKYWNFTLRTQRRLWSDWADAQVDLTLRWAHSHFVGFVMRRLICMVRISDRVLQCFSHITTVSGCDRTRDMILLQVTVSWYMYPFHPAQLTSKSMKNRYNRIPHPAPDTIREGNAINPYKPSVPFVVHRQTV